MCTNLSTLPLPFYLKKPQNQTLEDRLTTNIQQIDKYSSNNSSIDYSLEQYSKEYDEFLTTLSVKLRHQTLWSCTVLSIYSSVGEKQLGWIQDTD